MAAAVATADHGGNLPEAGGSLAPNSGEGRAVRSRSATPVGKLPRMKPGKPQKKPGISREMTFAKLMPIWLGSGTKDEVIEVENIREIVPDDMQFNDSVIAIERFESDATRYEAQQKYVVAAECYEQGINLRQKLLGDLNQGFLVTIERYVINCNLWGMQCLASGQYTLSLELLKKAESMTEEKNVPNFKRRIALRASTFSNFCCYFKVRGKLNAALQFAEKSLRIEQRYKEAESPARSYLNYAVLLGMMNRHDDALEQIECAIAVLHDQERQISLESESIEAGPATDAADGERGLPALQKKHHDVITNLVVAYYNMWVELTKLCRREIGMDFILRAANMARGKLGPSHHLTKKTEDALTWVQQHMGKAAFARSDAGAVGPSAEAALVAGSLQVQADPAARPDAGGNPLPVMESRIPWSCSPESFADALKAHNITVRFEPKRPPSRQKPVKRRFDSAYPCLEHIYGRINQTIPADVMQSLHNAARPKLSTAQDRSCYAGSPALQQQAHSSAIGKPSMAQTAAKASADKNGAAAAGASDAPQKVSLDSSLTPGLKAAYEYHRLREQHKDGFSGGDASAEVDAERLGAIGLFRTRLDQRREQLGLRVGTAAVQNQSATMIQACVRGYLARRWDLCELAADSRRRRNTEAQGRDSPRSDLDFESQADEGRGPRDMKQRVAMRVVYAARRAFVEYSAALKIQKAWRGYVIRRDIQQEVGQIVEDTVTRLQALFRRTRARMLMSLAHAAAIAIQGPWRRCIARRLATTRRTAARCLTRAGRRYNARLSLRRRQQDAMPVQCAVRGFLDRNHVLQRHDGALRFQKAFRGWQCRVRVLLMQKSASRIGATVRGHAFRQQLKRLNSAAELIQRKVRQRRAIKQVETSHAASAKIGTAWRGYKTRKSKPYRPSACKIQARVRGMQMRGRCRRKPPAALHIQAFWRAYRTRRRLKTLLALSTALQKTGRRFIQHRRLDRLVAAAVLCQRVARGYRLRRLLDYCSSRATLIQACWRRLCRRRAIVEAGLAAQRIQKVFKGYVQFRSYQACLAAVARIRAGWRGNVMRVSWKRNRRSAAVLIGRAYRLHFVRNRLLQLCRTVSSIQRRWRLWLAYSIECKRRKSAAKIQVAFRCQQQRLRARALAFIAPQIQSLWRMRSGQRLWQHRRKLVISLQAIQRGCKARAILRKQFQAVVCIQSYRRFVCHRREMRQKMSSARKLHLAWISQLELREQRREWNAAVVIQRNARGYIARKIKNRRVLEERLSAWMRGRYCRVRYLKIRQAVCVLQKRCGAWRVRRRYHSSMQGSGRNKAHHKQWQQAKELRRKTTSAMLIQRLWRGHAARTKMSSRNAPLVKIQRTAKGWLHLRRIKRRRFAACFIQKNWRRCTVLRHFKAAKVLNVRLASAWKAHVAFWYQLSVRRQRMRQMSTVLHVILVKKRLKNQKHAAWRIQRAVRGHLARRYVHFMKYVALIPIQCFFRQRAAIELTSKLRMRAYRDQERGANERKLRQEKLRYSAATRVQACQRMRVTRRNYHNKKLWAGPRIQAFDRMIIEKAEYKETRDAVVVQQTCVKTFLLLKLESKHAAAACIQRGVRYFLAHKCTDRKHFNDWVEQVNATNAIQACWRRYIQRWRYMRQTVGAVRIQAAARMHLEKLLWKKRKRAALRIQASLVKLWLASRAVQDRRQRVHKLQALAVAGCLRQQTRRNLRKILAIQSAWRSALSRTDNEKQRYRSAVKIQAFLRCCYDKNVLYPKRRVALLRIQADARGWVVRKRRREQNAAARRIQHKVRLARFRYVMKLRKWLVCSLQRIARGRRIRVHTLAASERLKRMPARMRGHNYRLADWPQQNSAATVCQRVYRGRLSRKELVRLHKVAIILQATWRMYTAKRSLVQRVGVAKTTSATYRFFKHNVRVGVLQKVYLWAQEAHAVRGPVVERKRARQAATTLQRFGRGLNSRRQIWRMKKAIVRIQSLARGVKARILYRRYRKALLLMQAHCDAAYQRQTFPETRSKVILLQAFTKMCVTRAQYHELRAAQITIARAVRAGFGRQRAQRLVRDRLALRKDAKAVLQRARHTVVQQAVLRLQAFWRRWLTREDVKSWPGLVTKIATAWRRSKARRRYLAVSRAAATIVTFSFTWRHARRLQTQKRAVAVISAAWRAFCAAGLRERRQVAARTIRHAWRRACQRAAFQDICVGVLVKARIMRDNYQGQFAKVIQRSFRAWSRRQHARHLRTRRAAIRIQTFCRRLRATDHVECLRQHTPVRLFRLHSQKVELIQDAAGRLTHFRELQAKGDASTTPSPNSQVVRWMLNVHSLPQRQKRAIAAKISVFQSLSKWQYHMTCVTRIQRRWRGYRERQALQAQGRAAVCIQAFWRGKRDAHDTKQRLNHLVRFQCHIRGFIERLRAKRLNAAGTTGGSSDGYVNR